MATKMQIDRHAQALNVPAIARKKQPTNVCHSIAFVFQFEFHLSRVRNFISFCFGIRHRSQWVTDVELIFHFYLRRSPYGLLRLLLLRRLHIDYNIHTKPFFFFFFLCGQLAVAAEARSDDASTKQRRKNKNKYIIELWESFESSWFSLSQFFERKRFMAAAVRLARSQRTSILCNRNA